MRRLWLQRRPRRIAFRYPILNETQALVGQFSSGDDNPIKTNGLFVGAGTSFATELLRLNAKSFMRDQADPAAQFFNRASVESWGRANIGDGEAATLRRVAVNAPDPNPFGDGPLQAVVVSTKHHRAFFSVPSGGTDALQVLSGVTLQHEKSISLAFAPGAETPRVLLLDEPRSRLVMRSRSTSQPNQSRLLFVDTDQLTASQLTVPDLFGFPGVDPSTGAIFVQTRNAAGEAAFQIIAGDAITPLDGPTSQPFFSSVPLVSTSQKLLLLTAGASTPSNAFCDATHCEIWAIDLATQALLPGHLSVDMTGEAVPPAIEQATIGTRADGSEMLVVASSTQIRGWKLTDLASALRGGTSAAPSINLTHTLGTGDVPLAGLAWVNAATDSVILGNRAGALTLFDLTGATTAENIALGQLKPGMQILGVKAAAPGTPADGYAVVTAAAFDGPRIGVTAVLDLATPASMLPAGAGRVVFEQPLAAAGLSAPGADWDGDWSLIYTTGVVDAGNPGEPNRFRTPVLRGPAALRYRGCLPASVTF